MHPAKTRNVNPCGVFEKEKGKGKKEKGKKKKEKGVQHDHCERRKGRSATMKKKEDGWIEKRIRKVKRKLYK